VLDAVLFLDALFLVVFSSDSKQSSKERRLCSPTPSTRTVTQPFDHFSTSPMRPASGPTDILTRFFAHWSLDIVLNTGISESMCFLASFEIPRLRLLPLLLLSKGATLSGNGSGRTAAAAEDFRASDLLLGAASQAFFRFGGGAVSKSQ